MYVHSVVAQVLKMVHIFFTRSLLLLYVSILFIIIKNSNYFSKILISSNVRSLVTLNKRSSHLFQQMVKL